MVDSLETEITITVAVITVVEILLGHEITSRFQDHLGPKDRLEGMESTESTDEMAYRV
jgi:hypothetical protein